MLRRIRWRHLFVGLLVAGFFFAAGWLIWADHILIVIHNQGNFDLAEVEIITESRMIPIGPIAKGEFSKYRLRYSGPASSIKIKFRGGLDFKIEKDCDTYIESGYKGTFVIDIIDDFVVKCEGIIQPF